MMEGVESVLKERVKDMSDNELAMRCAVKQAAVDLPHVEVIGVSVFGRRVGEELAHDEALRVKSPGERWYVELELRHRVDASIAGAVYRVWRDAGELKAMRVAVQFTGF